ncbi:MAG: hypothetical protein ACI865_002907 [Flavobacteriaceae bacterium]|jgi:hypothetical protein
MEKNAVNTSSVSSDRVVLELLGIDKKWVKDESGQWIDEQEALALIEASDSHHFDNIEPAKTSKWWQFRKR